MNSNAGYLIGSVLLAVMGWFFMRLTMSDLRKDKVSLRPSSLLSFAVLFGEPFRQGHAPTVAVLAIGTFLFVFGVASAIGSAASL